MRPLNIMVIAGEISGDIHAAHLIHELRLCHPELNAYGIGGDELEKEGVEIIYHTRDMAVMGISEVLKRLSFFRRVIDEMHALASERRPDILLTVDYPGFNLRLAKRVHELGIRTVQYISPKVWAWNARRIPRIAAAYDRLITILPFAAKSYEGQELEVVYAGNPLVDSAQKQLAAPPVEIPWNGPHRLALLPGSRQHEIERLMPVLLQTLVIIHKTYPQCSAVIPAPTEEIANRVRRTLCKYRDLIPSEEIPVVVGKARSVLMQADAAIVASGTATLEASLMRCPMVITYKVTSLSWLMAKIFVHVKFAGLVNLIAGREVCPELLQKRATPENISAAVLPLLEETEQRRKMLEAIEEVNRALGEPGASVRAAAAICP